MESIFEMAPETELPAYLQALMQHLGSSYICLWSHILPGHHAALLVFSGGFYRSSCPSPPSSSAANRHFQDYTQSTFTPINDRVPGHAFLINHPYVELHESELLRMASTLPQRLFYQEAKIKTAVFMGCRSGEIELGWSNPTAQLMSIETEMMKLFPDDFSRLLTASSTSTQAQVVLFDTTPPTMTTTTTITNPGRPPRPSSSSTSSVRSVLSLDQNSPEYSSFLLNLTNTAAATSPSAAFPPLHHPPPPPPHQQYAAGLFPSSTQEMEDAAMTRALLAVFTSPLPSTATTASASNHQGRGGRMPRRTTTAFKKFAASTAARGMMTTGGSASSSATSSTAGAVRAGQSMFKRAITYYRRSFVMMRSRDQQQQMNLASRPTTTQLHHMISERRRREKINDSFQSLRSLLPPDAKKDKASVLSRTKEYMSSLIAQVAELAEKNRQLESKLLLLNSRPPPATGDHVPVEIKEASQPESRSAETIPSDKRVVDVRLRTVEETTSSEQHRMVELQVTLRGGEESLVSDVVIRVLEFLRQVNNVDLMSLEGNAAAEPEPRRRFSRAVFRLQIEGEEEWDEAAFQEAVRRVVADLAQ